jgi:AMMECR1 domain-containing protein
MDNKNIQVEIVKELGPNENTPNLEFNIIIVGKEGMYIIIIYKQKYFYRIRSRKKNFIEFYQ